MIYSMCTGYKPAYSQDTSSFGSAVCESVELITVRSADISSFSYSRTLLRTLDRGLYNIVKDIQGLSQVINGSNNSGQKISEMTLEELLTSVQSRLLMLDFSVGNVLAEILRLSLHAYLTTIFWSFPGIKFNYPHLATQFRQACLAFSPTTAGDNFLFAWALMVGAISVFHGHDQDWLLERLYPLIGNSLGTMWLEVKLSLSQVMWIGSIHDGPGVEVFSQYLRNNRGGTAISSEGSCKV